MAASSTDGWRSRSLDALSAQHCADSVEQCKQRPDLVTIGTYELDEVTRIRHGGFQVLKCVRGVDGAAVNFKKSLFVDAPGVLDAKWSSIPLGTDGLSVLASATATGVVELYSLDEAVVDGEVEAAPLSLLTTSHVLVDGDDSMALSLDWDNRLAGAKDQHSAPSGRIAVSSTHSTVHILEASPTGLEELSSWRAHEFFGGMDIQVWITAFNAWNTQVVLSGADDSKCKLWDLRMAGTPLWTSSVHGAGVGSAQWSHLLEHVFATGSYDGTVAVWDDRNKKTPLVQHEQGGGVWRIKWHPTRADTVATAAMRGGFHVLQLDALAADGSDGYSDVSVTQDTLFDGHAALAKQQGVDLLAYGVDWVATDSAAAGECGGVCQSVDAAHIVSCSFYDKAVHVWQAFSEEASGHKRQTQADHSDDFGCDKV